MPSAARLISGEWAATLTGSTMARLAPSSLALLGGCLDGGALAADHDLAGRVAIGDGEDADRLAGRLELGDVARRAGR